MIVFVASPYAGNVAHNTERAKLFCRFVAKRGHVPYAPHLFFPQFLDESDPKQRKHGMKMGLKMLAHCDELWAFGVITEGVAAEIAEAERLGKRVRRF